MLEKTDPFFHLLDHSTLSGGGFILRDVTYNRIALPSPKKLQCSPYE